MTLGAPTAPLIQPVPEGALAIPNNLKNCDVVITPACIKALYQVPKAELAADGNSLGIFEEGDYYAQEDLNLFFANYTPYIPRGTHPIPAFIDGAHAPVALKNAGGESELDFELAYPLIYPQSITLYQTDDKFYATNSTNTASGGFNTFLDALDGVSLIFTVQLTCHLLTSALLVLLYLQRLRRDWQRPKPRSPLPRP